MRYLKARIIMRRIEADVKKYQDILPKNEDEIIKLIEEIEKDD